MKRLFAILVFAFAFHAFAALKTKVPPPFAKDGELLLEPTYCCCSVEFGASKPIEGLRLEYRGSGDEWRAIPAREWHHYARSRTYRASIRDIEEDASYEVRLTANGQVVKAGAFRTWKSDVPIARTIELSVGEKLPIVISEKGTADGWIRFTAPNALDFGESEEDAMSVEGAAYVVFDGLRIRGTRGRHVFRMKNCRYVRFINCDFSRWGRVGKPRFDQYGRNFMPDMGRKSYGINYDSAIEIGEGCFGVTVERCYFHEPRGRANSWYYSPEGVMMAHAAGSTVIRWNDFVGSDDHRWNDAVEGLGNFSYDGGFNRTGDVYGNFMVYCNDDCIEMDGGQRNVRNFDNRYEGALCGVSVQGCMVGPSYVYRNLFSGMCGEFGEAGQTLKTGGGLHGPEAEVFAEKNVFWGRGSGITLLTNLTVVSSGNVFCGKQKINQIRYLKWPTTSSSTEGDVTKEIAERDLDAAYPIRPMSLMLDGARFSGFKVKGGVCKPSAFVVRARSKGRACRFRIAKNGEFDWLAVSPAEGMVPADGEFPLTVTVDASKMRDRRWYRGAFLARDENGFSRPFTVYAETDFVPPYRPVVGNPRTIYADGFMEGEYAAFPKKGRTVEVSVPEDGRYYVMLHGVGAGHVMGAVDGDPLEDSRQQGQDYPVWTMLTPGRKQGNMLRHYDLAKGRHTVRLSGCGGAFRCDGVAVTDNPLAFEPR